MRTVVAPWETSLSPAEHSLIFYALVIAGFALFAFFVYSWTTRGEVSARYRPAVLASMCVTGIAFLAYAFLTIKFDVGYDAKGGSWVPNSDAIWSWAARYMDWSVTVPLLIIEIIGVSALVGAAARRMRFVGVGAAFLMVFTGYLGAVVIGGGTDLGARWTWGIISSIFFIIAYAVVIVTVVRSTKKMSSDAATSYRNAMILLLIVWFAYPIVYGFAGLVSGGGWTLGYQLALSAADVLAKVGMAVLIHKVAKIRTADDVAAGLDTMPESVWTSSLKRSDAVLPPMAAAAPVTTVAGSSRASDPVADTETAPTRRRGRR